jgi:hypothetical protein
MAQRFTLLWVALWCGMVWVLLVLPLAAQQSESPISFTGSTRLTGQAASRVGTNQFVPASFLRFDFNSTLIAYGIPLTMNGLLTTEQQNARQSLNYFNVGFSRDDVQQQIRRKAFEKSQRLQALQAAVDSRGESLVRDSLSKLGDEQLRELNDLPKLDKLKELQSLKSDDLQKRVGELQELGLASKMQGWTSFFPKFSVGTNFTEYTPLTLSGVPVTGLDIEVKPGPVFLAFTTGGIQNARLGSEGFLGIPTFGTALTTESYDRRITAGRLGVGSKDESNILLSVVYGKDNPNSRSRDTLRGILTPKENLVLGASSRLQLLDSKLSIESEVALAALTSDIDAPKPDDIKVPGFIKNAFTINLSTSTDYAFSVQTKYDISQTGTRLSAMVRRIGAGYVSLGVPFLRNDYLRYEGKIDQVFLNRQVSLSAFLRNDRDNLAQSKRDETSLSALGFTLGMNFRNLPYVKISYAPLSQQSNRLADSLRVSNQVNNASVVTGYTFSSESGLVSSSNFSFVYQDGKTASGIGAYLSRNFIFSQYVTFAFPLGLGVTLSDIQTIVDTQALEVFTADLSASYTAFGAWQNTFGTAISNGTVQRTTIYFTTAFPVWKLGQLSLTAERTDFKDNLISSMNYNETVGRLSFSRSW